MPEPDAPTPFTIDRVRMAQSFDRASATYDGAAVLQRSVRDELLDRLAFFKLSPRSVLDLGTGTGHGAEAMKRAHPKADVFALDIAPSMVDAAVARGRFWRRIRGVCADASRLPFPDASFDVVFSSLMLQWCEDLDTAFAEVRRVLRPEGVFVYSTFGPNTLMELRESWRAVDERPHVNQFFDMHDIGEAMSRAGFREPVLDVERYTLAYDDARELMRDLKAIGAHNVARGRARGLTGRRTLQAMLAAYETFRREGKLPASYEVVFGVGWGRPPSAEPLTGSSHDGEIRIPVDSIRRRTR